MATLKRDTVDWIRGLRRQLGLTQSQLAERLGVTLVTVSRWETGQARPNSLARKALASLAEGISAPLASDPSG